MQVGLRLGFIVMAGVAAFAAAGCSGSGGLSDAPTGNIVLTDAATGAVLNTSAENPYRVPDLRFTIDANEPKFAGPYDVQIVQQTSLPTQANGGQPYGFAFSEPCFTVSQDTTFTSNAVPLVFVGSNANGQPYNFPNGGLPPTPMPAPAGSPTPQPTATPGGNPCHSGEFEVATISDSKGHTVKFYYEELP